MALSMDELLRVPGPPPLSPEDSLKAMRVKPGYTAQLVAHEPLVQDPVFGPLVAFGPGGVFAVTVVDHGRARIMVAGDVVQINGKRPPYVSDAIRDAKRASKAISAAVGLQVPVTPALTFVGTGVITFYGLPKGCLVAPHQNLDRLLVANGNRISVATAQKLSRIAERPTTWQPAGQPTTHDYGWYAQGRTAADKRPSPR